MGLMIWVAPLLIPAAAPAQSTATGNPPRNGHEFLPLPRSPYVNGPLRYENISDIEVRQVQDVVGGILPGALVYISGVVHGCGCEEAASCTDQLSVVAQRGGLDSTLTLSKTDGQWKIGRLQDWWMRYSRLQKDYRERRQALSDAAPADRLALSIEHGQATQDVLAEMPACRNDRTAETTAASR